MWFTAMSNDRLELDLEFLSKNKPSEEEEKKSHYRINRKNIAIITVIAGGLGLAIFQDSKPAPAPRSAPAPTFQVPSEQI